MAEFEKQLKRARQGKQIQWRRLVNVRDISDILSMVGSLTRILNQRGQMAVGQVEHGIRESRLLEDVINIVDRLGKLVVRKSREFEQKGAEAIHTVEQKGAEAVHTVEQKGVEAVHTVEQEVRESPVVERIDARIHRQERLEEERRRAQEAQADTNVFVVGAVLALWFAPRSGEETRHEIEHTADDMRRRVEGESLHDAIEAGKAEARRLQQTINSR